MKRIALMTCLWFGAAACQAQDKPLWELGLGAGVLRVPHYRGSDQAHTWLLPIPYVVYRGRIFRADREGARAVLLNTDRLDIDLSAAASPPTRSRDDTARRGMADLAPTFELGPNVNLTLARGSDWKLDLRVPVRAAMTLESHPKAIGWVATPNLNLDLAHLRGWNLGLVAGPEFASRRFHGYFYDVSPAQAAAGRPAYSAAGGAAGGRVVAALSRRSGPAWTGFFVRYDTLRGAVFADSPLVRQRDAWSVGMAFTWVFATSSQPARADEE